VAQAADQHRAFAMVQRIAFGLGDRVRPGRFGRRGLGQRVGHQHVRPLLGGIGIRGSLAFASRGLCAVQRCAEGTRLAHHSGALRGAFQDGGEVVGIEVRIPMKTASDSD
jgi:hypothetical protein